MELTPVSLGLMAALALFALQLILCLKTKRLAVRLVPLYIAAGFALYAAATFLGLFGTYSAGALAGHELAGIVLFFAAGAAAVGSLLGWAVFALASKLRDSRPARPEGGATHAPKPRIWKKAALAVAAAAVAVCAVVCLSPELRARSFVALHGDGIESAIEAGHGVPSWLADYDYNSYAREHSMLQITLTARGGTYCGCYYSFDGVPLPFQNADVPLAQTGDERWEWRAEGDNRGSTERISEKWFYFEASF